MIEETVYRSADISESATAQLLNRDAPPEYLQQWTAYVASKPFTEKPGTQSVVFFRIGPEWLALPTHLLQEVVQQCTIRTLPHRRGGIVRGLINVRGELLLCVSLPAMLGMEKPAERHPTAKDAVGQRVLILNRAGGQFAFPVDEVHSVHRYHPSELRPAPATLRSTGTPIYLKGMLPWQGKSVGCLSEGILATGLTQGLA